MAVKPPRGSFQLQVDPKWDGNLANEAVMVELWRRLSLDRLGSPRQMHGSRSPAASSLAPR